MLSPGTLLQNRYLVREQIGQGGMGTVYVATDQRFGSTVALKETHFDDPALRKAFEREARLLHHLRHAALPKVTDYFAEADGLFLVMEFIPGEDLSELLVRRGGAFSVAEVSSWADQLLDALDYLHAQEPPVIHRDIKPQNLKLTARNQIVLLDFGLAKGSAAQMTRASAAGSVFGYSRNYAPLEQIQGAGTDPRSDIYSLAATLFHLVTGLAPPDALTRATAVLNGQPDPLLTTLEELHAHVPASLVDALARAMALNAGQRPQTAASMRELLREAAGQHADAAAQKTTAPHASPTAPHERETQLLGTRSPTNAVPDAFAQETRRMSAPEAAMLIDKQAAASSAETARAAHEEASRSIAREDSVATRVRAARADDERRSGVLRFVGVAVSALLLVGVALGVYTFMSRPATDTPQEQTTNETTPAPAAQSSAEPSSAETLSGAQADTSPSAPASVVSPVVVQQPSQASSNKTAAREAKAQPGTANAPPNTPAAPEVPTNNTQADRNNAEEEDDDADSERDDPFAAAQRRGGPPPFTPEEMRRVREELRNARGPRQRRALRRRVMEEMRRRQQTQRP